MKSKPKILFEDNHLLVVEKPINMPVQEDASKDLDLLNELKKYLKEKYKKPGNIFLGLVHRLDRPVGGVMVFARTSKAASRISEQIRNGEMRKTYLAVVEGVPDKKSGELVHHLTKDEQKNIVRVSEDGKESKLFYKVLESKNNLSLVKINLITGRSHQIRIQFKAIGHSIVGDVKYGQNKKQSMPIALWAYELGFKHPTKDEYKEFRASPPKTPPWETFRALKNL